jgi:uncharacterized protein with beta-barrel porin domain
VLGAVDSLSAPQARAAFDAASGAGIVELRRASAGFAASFGSRLQARLAAVQNRGTGTLANSFGDRPLLLAANDTLPELMAPASDVPRQKFSLAGNAAALPATPDADSGLWARGFGGYGNTDADGNAAASRLRSSGLSVGFDAEIKEGGLWRLRQRRVELQRLGRHELGQKPHGPRHRLRHGQPHRQRRL